MNISKSIIEEILKRSEYLRDNANTVTFDNFFKIVIVLDES